MDGHSGGAHDDLRPPQSSHDIMVDKVCIPHARIGKPYQPAPPESEGTEQHRCLSEPPLARLARRLDSGNHCPRSSIAYYPRSLRTSTSNPEAHPGCTLKSAMVHATLAWLDIRPVDVSTHLHLGSKGRYRTNPVPQSVQRQLHKHTCGG